MHKDPPRRFTSGLARKDRKVPADLNLALYDLDKQIRRRGARKAAIMARSHRIDDANEAIRTALREDYDR